MALLAHGEQLAGRLLGGLGGRQRGRHTDRIEQRRKARIRSGIDPVQCIDDPGRGHAHRAAAAAETLVQAVTAERGQDFAAVEQHHRGNT